MKYTYADARNIEDEYGRLPNGNSREARLARRAFLNALSACGIRFVAYDTKRVHPLRVYAADGNDFPKAEIDAYKTACEALEKN